MAAQPTKWQDFLAFPTNLRKVVALMANVSQLLNEVADGLRGNLSTSVQELIAENARLAAENAGLSGEDAEESTAAENVKSAFNELAAKFRNEPDVPDVPDLPEEPVEDGNVPTDGL